MSRAEVLGAISAEVSTTHTHGNSGASLVAVLNAVANGLTAAEDLATVATSGSYDDLAEKPTIPAATSQLTNDMGFLDSSALSGYAPLASPALTGTPTAPTPSSSDNSTNIATTAFLHTALAALAGTTPTLLATLQEIDAALSNDPNFAITMTTALAGKVPTSRSVNTGTGLSGGGALSGDLTIAPATGYAIPTSTQIASWNTAAALAATAIQSLGWLATAANTASGPVQLGSEGKLPALNASNLTNVPAPTYSAPTVVNGSVSGSAQFSQPDVAQYRKTCLIYLNALSGSASYTFSPAFTYVPDKLGSGAANITSLSATSVTVAGRVLSQCGSFSGTNYITASSTNLPTGDNPISVFAWVKMTNGQANNANTNLGAVFKYGTDGQSYKLRNFVLGSNFSGSSNYAMGFSGYNADGGVTTSTKLNDGNWHFVGFVYSGSKNITFYVDGTSYSATLANTLNTPSSTTAYIGCRTPSGEVDAFTGQIEEVQVYNTALNSSQVAQIYNSGAGVYGIPSGLTAVAGYHLDGTTVDYVNAVNGSWTGTAAYSAGMIYSAASVSGFIHIYGY